MKKKLVAMLLVTTMITGLVGCGGQSSSDSAQTDNNAAASTDEAAAADDASASTDSSAIDTSEHVVITYMTTGEKPTATAEKYDEMMAKLNEILTEKCNAELQTYFISWTDYLSTYKLTLAQMDGTVDLVGTASA